MSDEQNPNEEHFRKALDAVNWKVGDERMLTDAERKNLTRLMYLAFCDLRRLARDGKIEQARALAEAFHNIPFTDVHSEFQLSRIQRVPPTVSGQPRKGSIQLPAGMGEVEHGKLWSMKFK